MNIFLVISYLLSGLFIPNQWNDAEEIGLTSVNHITLYDDVAVVIEKKGAPNDVTIDPYFEEYVTLTYSDMEISFRDNAIQQIQIGHREETLFLGGTEVQATVEAIRSALGEPDYVAEDGLVFQRKEALLKLYINQESGKLETITYYHIAST